MSLPSSSQVAADGGDEGMDATAPPGQAAGSRSKRSRRMLLWGRLSIQSKLLVMLLTVSVLATLVAGAVGYQSGSTALEAAAYEKLISARDARARELKRFSPIWATPWR